MEQAPVTFSYNSYLKNRVDRLVKSFQSSASSEHTKASFEQAINKSSYRGAFAELKHFFRLLVDSEDKDELRASLVRRRKYVEDAFLPILDFAYVNSSAADEEKVEALYAFQHRHESEMGHFVVEAMRPEHMHNTKELLVEWRITELMGWLLIDRPFLAYLVKEYVLAITATQYVLERHAELTDLVTLVGLYSDSDSLVAGTVELWFCPAKDPGMPDVAFIGNLVIKNEYRRRGLGRQMLKAAEDLELSMGCEHMYLHVQIIDTAPLTMYKEAGYQVVSTDSLLSVLTFQRRNHLMRKRLS